MKKAPQYLGRAGSEQARERLAAYVRYAALIADQEAALEADDLDTFDALTREIAEVRNEIPPSEGSGDAESNDAAEVLQQALATNRRIQKRLAAMKKSGGEEIRNSGRWRAPAKRYLADKERPTTHIDVTS